MSLLQTQTQTGLHAVPLAHSDNPKHHVFSVKDFEVPFDEARFTRLHQDLLQNLNQYLTPKPATLRRAALCVLTYTETVILKEVLL